MALSIRRQSSESGSGEADYIFVYGSLRPDCSDKSDSDRKKSKFAEDTESFGAKLQYASLYLDGPRPVVTFEGTGNVTGYAITSLTPECFASKLRLCDDIYGYPKKFDRTVTEVTLDSGEIVNAHVYYQTEVDRSNQISSGDWLKL